MAEVYGVVSAPDRDPLDVAGRDVLGLGELDGDVLPPEFAEDGDAAVPVGVRGLWARGRVPKEGRKTSNVHDNFLIQLNQLTA